MNHITTLEDMKKAKSAELKRLIKAAENCNIVSNLSILADVLEKNELTETILETTMKVLNKKVRVAKWIIKDNRCWHKEYKIGSVKSSSIGNIGKKDGDTWIEAWIA